ncbi:ATP-binding protein [Helicobacter typhlonius]|uniref:ATP-binding protein n=2 Tax=Helicobacter TaxID=209 RepID=UPI002FE027D2
MQRPVNLLEICNLFKEKELLSDKHIKEFLQIQNVKEHEIQSLCLLCQEFKKLNNENFNIFEGYYINYTIPQIGKEFDLVRFEKNRIINIELKFEEIAANKILKQLQRNYHYFSPLNKEIHCYTFVTTQKKLYKYFKGELKEIETPNLLQELREFESEQRHPDTLFTPINYLISPFNNTQSFIDEQYFLTNYQEQICKEILEKIHQKSHYIFSISGQAGTGKTLLTYHIAKKLMKQSYKVVIVHCASLNEGIYKLRDLKWNIYPIKDFNHIKQIQADIIIVDESQRISVKQLKEILQIKENGILIFSHDVHQRLNRANEAKEVTQAIQKVAKGADYKLKNKIRHNKEIAYFIKKIFNPKNKESQDSKPKEFKNISLYYANNLQDTQEYVNFLIKEKWKYIYLSTSLHTQEKLSQVQFSSDTSSHQAIGQEWDNIVIIITEDFYYTEEGRLSYKARAYYNPLETLFQALTRVRKRLKLIIINNPDIYKKCVEILCES